METKLYVGNLSYSTTEDELRNLFAQAGTVTSVDVIKDKMTGNSKGFAFIQMSSQQDVEKAIAMFNGYKLVNRELRVNVARPKEDNRFGSSSGGYNRDSAGRGYDRKDRNSGSNRY